MKKKGEIRKKFEERTKYLMGTDYMELSEEDKVHKIIIKVVLTKDEYELLCVWCKQRWSITRTAEIVGESNCKTEKNISKIITNLKQFVWSYKNNPFIKDEEREKLVNKHIWYGDIIMKIFLGTDFMAMSVTEYINISSK